MNIARVFPRRTNASPNDEYTFFDVPGFAEMLPPIDAVHVSVTFTDDMPRAEALAREWERIAPVSIGGPATGMRGEEFIPGMYLRQGYVITSRGCPNRCWFCSVWRREGEDVRELPITEGHNVLDDNLLACSEAHVRGVFEMLSRQKCGTVEFTGGLEAALLRPWHVDLLAKLRPRQAFFAYDEPRDYEPLLVAGKMLREAGITVSTRIPRAYVLIGYPKDTLFAAESRLMETLDAGFIPHAMLYQDGKRNPRRDWQRLQREWARPAIIMSRLKETFA